MPISSGSQWSGPWIIMKYQLPINWLWFKEAFFRKWYTAVIRYWKQGEFLNLKQGDNYWSIWSRIHRLLRFNPELVNTEDMNVKQFIMDSRGEIEGIVAALAPPCYATSFEQLHSCPCILFKPHRCLVNKVLALNLDKSLCRTCGKCHLKNVG